MTHLSRSAYSSSFDGGVAHFGVRGLVLLLLSVLLFAPSQLLAQSATSCMGGNVSNAYGSVEFTVGQASCFYSEGGGFRSSEGVQQPYCITTYDTFVAQICFGSPYSGFGFDLSTDSIPAVGTFFFKHQYEDVEGCDSLVTLRLEVRDAVAVTQACSACDGFVWNGNTYTESICDTMHYLSSAGCDSAAILNLTIYHSSTTDIYEQTPFSYTWLGQTYSASGDYSHSYTNAHGCDSVVTLHLSISSFNTPHIYCYDGRLLVVDHYPSGEGVRIDYAAYRWFRDGEVIQAPYNRDYYARINGGVYERLQGCFSVEVPTDASARIWVRSNTICLDTTLSAKLPTPALALFPNPVAQGAVLHVTLEHVPEGANLSVYDNYGRLFHQQVVAEAEFTIPVTFPTGVYTMQVSPAVPDQPEFKNPLVRRFIVR